MSKMDFLPVILGSDLNAYGMARSFHMAYGVKSYAIGKGVLFMTRHSSIIDVRVCKDLDDDATFIQEMTKMAIELKTMAKKLVLVASSDNYAELAIRNRDQLAAHYELPFATEDLMDTLIYKSSFYKVCETYGLDFPKTIICNKENYRVQHIDLGFPIVVKPSDSMKYFNAEFEGKKKAYILDTEEEMYHAMELIYGSDYDDDLIIQEFIPGDDSNMRVVNSYSRRDGKVSMMSLGRPLLEDCTPRLIGNYVAIVNEYNEAIYKNIQNFLEQINYTGFANFDLKYDARDGKYKVFEINLRQGRSSFFSTASGFNLGQYVVEDLVYHKKEAVKFNRNEHLWLNVSKSLVLKYLDDQMLIDQVKVLIKEQKWSDTLTYKADRHLKRTMDRMKYYRGYDKRFKQYFVKK